MCSHKCNRLGEAYKLTSGLEGGGLGLQSNRRFGWGDGLLLISTTEGP